MKELSTENRPKMFNDENANVIYLICNRYFDIPVHHLCSLKSNMRICYTIFSSALITFHESDTLKTRYFVSVLG